MKHFIAALVLLFASANVMAGPGLWHDPEHPGHGVLITQDMGAGHGVIWFLHRTDGSSAFLIASENCEEFPCVVPMHEVEAAWMGGAFPGSGSSFAFDFQDPVGSLEMRQLEDGRIATKFDLRAFRPADCFGIGGSGLILRGCIGTITMELLADN
jgi:hypothetical protein